MAVLVIYTYVAAGILFLLLLQRYVLHIFRFLFNPRLFVLFSRRLMLPYLFHRRRFWGPISWLRASLHVLHLGGTLTCNITGVHNISTARSRAGTLAVLHLIPLFFVPNLSLAAEIFGFSLSVYHHFHRALGWMTILQVALHVIFALYKAALDLNDRAQRHGFMAALALVATLIIILPWIRQWLFELALKGHMLLGLFVVVTAWLHLERRYEFDGICLIVAIGLYSLTSILHIIRQAIRNVVAGRSLAVAKLTKSQDAVELTFQPPRSWKVRAGQYIYIRAPAIRFWSFAESHPFCVAWWENGPDGKAVTMSVLAKVESGFTRSLSTSRYNEVRILIDGPYGGPIDTKPYTGVAMMATGAGIAAQLPYVKELLEFQQSAKGIREKGEHNTRQQRISLIWQLDEECHEDWICDWMDRLLDEDLKTLAIHYSLYILNRTGKDRKDGQKVKIGRRGGEYYGKPDLKGMLEKELQAVSGKLLVTVSADPQTRDELRGLVLSSSERVEFHELDFQPSEKYSGFWAPKKQTTHIGVA